MLEGFLFSYQSSSEEVGGTLPWTWVSITVKECQQHVDNVSFHFPEFSRTIPTPGRPGRLGVGDVKLGLGIRPTLLESFALPRGILGGRSREVPGETGR